MNYSISDFSGGMSQDDTFLGKGQCIFQQGIDTIRFPGELRLMPELKYSYLNGTEEVNSIFSPENGIIWFGTDDGDVRNYDGTMQIPTGNTREILDGILFRGNFYIFDTRYVYQAAYSSGSLSGLTTFFDHGGNVDYIHPVIYASNEMYFPSGKQIKYVDEFGNINTLPQTFSTKVKALSVSGNTLRIYTENTLAILDVGTKTVLYSQQLPFVTGGITTDGITDYVVSEGYELYMCSGLEWRKMAFFQKSETLGASDEINTKFSFANSQTGKRMSCANGRLITIDQVEDRVLMYGSKMQGLPQAFQYLPKYDNQTTGGANVFPISPRCVFAQNNQIYIGYTCNGQQRIGKIDLEAYALTGYTHEGVWISNSTDLGDYSILKNIEEIRVGKEGTGGELLCSIDGADFELVGALDQTEVEQKFMNYKKDFREVAFMIKLYSQFDKIKNINVRYNQRQV